MFYYRQKTHSHILHNGNSENLPSGNQINGTQLKLFADGNKNAIKVRCTKNMSQLESRKPF